MKRITFMTLAAAALLSLAACQESFDDRCAREAREYTRKNCPGRLSDNVVMDSMVFDRSTHTMCYYYTVSGTAEQLAAIRKTDPRKALLEAVKNNTSTRVYKDAGYSFRYIWYQKDQPGKALFDFTFTERDYK